MAGAPKHVMPTTATRPLPHWPTTIPGLPPAVMMVCASGRACRSCTKKQTGGGSKAAAPIARDLLAEAQKRYSARKPETGKVAAVDGDGKRG